MTRMEIKSDFKRNKYIYLMAIPVLAFYIIFHYAPMYGAIMAFKDFNPAHGILGSDWVGFEHFKQFFQGVYFGRLIKNTLLISLYSLLWGFPAPIILALLLNEVSNKYFKRAAQTITYLPHFISMVVVCGIIVDFTSSEGIITSIVAMFGGETTNLLMKAELFRTIYVASGIWQGVGWGSIIYLATMSNIDTQLYEAAIIDGANKWKQVLNVTLPSIAPTIVILLVLRMGSIMSVGFEKIILLYNPRIMETADVISTYVYRRGLLDFDYSFSAAVGLFNSAINFVLIILANKLSRNVSETSLW